MSRLTVRHWSVQADPTGPDLDFHTMSERYNHLRPGSPVTDRVESMPFYSRPFTIAVWSSQINYAGPATPQVYPTELLDTAERALRLKQKRAEVEKAYLKSAEGLKEDNQEDLIRLGDLVKKRDEELSKLTVDASAAADPSPLSTDVKLGQGKYRYTETKIKYAIDFHIPPNSISWNYQHALIKNKTRGGWQLERSPENLVTLEVEGTSGVFYHGEHGTTRLHAKSTYGYKELMDLAQVYRNNGMSYDPVSGVIYTIGEVLLYYDNIVYVGSFDAFDLKENESSPFKFDYSFTFVSRGEQGQSNVIGHNVKASMGLQNLRAASLILPNSDRRIISRQESIVQKSPTKIVYSATSTGSVETITLPSSYDANLTPPIVTNPFNPETEQEIFA